MSFTSSLSLLRDFFPSSTWLRDWNFFVNNFREFSSSSPSADFRSNELYVLLMKHSCVYDGKINNFPHPLNSSRKSLPTGRKLSSNLGQVRGWSGTFQESMNLSVSLTAGREQRSFREMMKSFMGITGAWSVCSQRLYSLKLSIEGFENSSTATKYSTRILTQQTPQTLQITDHSSSLRVLDRRLRW